MTKLSVNVNAVAYLRNRRDVPWPDLLQICRAVMDAGSIGITVHPRPDERHVRRSDVQNISQLIAREYPTAEFNIEGYPTDDFLDLCKAAKPAQVTLVPDAPGQSTSDHGWDIAANSEMLRDVIARIKAFGARVSLFVDPDPSLAALAGDVGADRIEIYTGPYGGATGATAKAELEKIIATVDAAKTLGLGVNIGHDLTDDNLRPIMARTNYVTEASIGHGITAHALMVGFPQAVRDYIAALDSRG